MADVTATPDGGAQITISQSETSGLKALAAQHVPATPAVPSRGLPGTLPLRSAGAADFLESLAIQPARRIHADRQRTAGADAAGAADRAHPRLPAGPRRRGVPGRPGAARVREGAAVSGLPAARPG